MRFLALTFDRIDAAQYSNPHRGQQHSHYIRIKHGYMHTQCLLPSRPFISVPSGHSRTQASVENRVHAHIMYEDIRTSIYIVKCACVPESGARNLHSLYMYVSLAVGKPVPCALRVEIGRATCPPSSTHTHAHAHANHPAHNMLSRDLSANFADAC